MKIMKKHDGLTLIEIVVSIAILGIIITPLASLFVSSVRNNVNANDRLRANQLAQMYTEQLMEDPFNTTIPSENGDYTINAQATLVNSDYANRSQIGTTDPISYDEIIDFCNEKWNTVVDGDTLDMDINITDIMVKKGPTIFSTKGYTNSPINIQVKSKENLNINLNVSNTSGKRVRIYKVYTQNGQDNIIVNDTEGEIYTYENIYDNSVLNPNKNRVYRIRVTVSNANGILADLVTFETIK